MAKTVTHQDLKSFFGQEDHLEKSKTTSFAGMIFELLSEKKPTEAELKVFELILNLSIDHGPDTPSAIPVIEAAKAGKPIGEAIAAGMTQINDVHGGAQEKLMGILYRIKNQEVGIKELLESYLKEGKRLPGFGHRIYQNTDPRAQLILSKLQEANLGEEYIQIAKQLEQELQTQTGKTLPLNIDGAIAVALCAFGWEPKLGKAVFIIARTPGLCAHYLNNS